MSNVTHMLASFKALVRALRASGEVVHDDRLLRELDSLLGRVTTLTDSYHQWWQVWQRTSSSVRCQKEEDLRALLPFKLEKVTRKAGEVARLIEEHATAAGDSAHEQGEQFAHDAQFKLSDILWGHAKLMPLMLDTLCASILQKVALALATQAKA